MKHFLLLGLLFSFIFALPSVSYAQVGFGGMDLFRFPMCTCVPLPPPAKPIPGAIFPAVNFFDFFLFMTDVSPVRAGGFLAVPIPMKLLPAISPSPLMAPGECALGYMIPTVKIDWCGIIIPTPPPFGPLCIAILPSVGMVTPYTGAVPGFCIP